MQLSTRNAFTELYYNVSIINAYYLCIISLCLSSISLLSLCLCSLCLLSLCIYPLSLRYLICTSTCLLHCSHSSYTLSLHTLSLHQLSLSTHSSSPHTLSPHSLSTLPYLSDFTPSGSSSLPLPTLLHALVVSVMHNFLRKSMVASFLHNNEYGFQETGWEWGVWRRQFWTSWAHSWPLVGITHHNAARYGTCTLVYNSVAGITQHNMAIKGNRTLAYTSMLSCPNSDNGKQHNVPQK